MTDRSQRRALPIVLAALLALCLMPLATSAATAAAPGKSQAAQGKRRGARPKTNRRASKPSAGGALLSGKKAPTSRVGKRGDFYLRTSNHSLYGPKTARGWGRATSLVGPQGAQGAQGLQGPQGLAGTPAFGTGQATSFSPVTLTATYDADGNAVSAPVEIGSVTVPAGPALVQMRLSATPGAGFEGSADIGCNASSPFAWVAGAWASPSRLTTDEIGWTSFPAPVTVPVICRVENYGGTPGDTVTGTITAAQIVVFPTNVPAL